MLPSNAFTDKAHRAIACIIIDHIKKYGTAPGEQVVLYELKTKFKDDKSLLRILGEAKGIYNYMPEYYDRGYLADKIREFARIDLIRRGIHKWLQTAEKGEPDVGPFRQALAQLDRMADEGRGRRGYLIKDLFLLPAMDWVVDKHLTEGGFSCIFGEYESGKTFIGLDLALCIATGKDYLGKFRVHKPGPVAYVIGEGHGGVRKRIYAWMRHHGVEEVPKFVLVPAQYNMLEGPEAQAVMDTAVEQLGCHPSHVFFDTLTKMFGAGDSSSSKDMTAYVNNLLAVQEIGRRNGTTLAVVSIHHTGKDRARGSLGSVVLPGACDSMIEVSGEVAKAVHVHCHKQKDGSKFPDYDLVMRHVEVPGEIDPSGEGSLVLVRKSGQFDSLTDAEGDALLALSRKFGHESFTWKQGVEAQQGQRGKNKASEMLNKLKEKDYLVIGETTPYRINPEAAPVIAVLERERQSSDEEKIDLIVGGFAEVRQSA